ncbi:MAG: leucine/isoleucine/valine transporter permease subunit [Syntrophorhabdus sp. PtaU1.Bin153]|nr:MAG: leucine/isoleucine/valine transporter permease subunit [Syntrophorhabdus sp. PtaU1.Bin153]
MDYIIHILILIGIYAILSISLNLVASAGIISVAHGALFGLGAYVYAVLGATFHLPFSVALVFSSLATTFTGILLAVPSLRLKGDYLALATFGFAIIAYDIFDNLLLFTKGPMGITDIQGPDFPFQVHGKTWYLFLVTAFAVVTYLLARRLLQSPWGRVIRAISEKESLVTFSGRNTYRYKLVTFAFASFWTGVAGSLYSSYLSYIHPSNFLPMTSILILCMVVAGGMGSLTGSILGTSIFICVPEVLRFLNLPSSVAGNTNELLFGLALILFMLFKPQGILGKYLSLNE